MKKLPLRNKLKGEHKSDNAVLMGTAALRAVEKDSKDERIKKPFAQDDLIYQRVKCPAVAVACCLIDQV